MISTWFPRDVFDRVVLLCGAIAAGIGGAVLACWMLDWDALTDARWGHVPMAPNTALLFLLLGGALAAGVTRLGSRMVRAGVAVAATVTVILAGATLVGPVIRYEFNIDTWLIDGVSTLNGLTVGRMSPVTASCFLLAGVGVLLSRRLSKAPTAILGIATTLVGAVTVLGYWYGAPLLYGGNTIPVALPTAMAFGALGAGLVAAAGPGAWPLNRLTGASTRARLLRGLLPAILVLTLIQDWIVTSFLERPDTRAVLACALSTIVSLLIFSLVISRVSHAVAARIDQAEAEREHTEEALRRSEELYRSLVENVDAGITLIDADRTIITVNSAQAKSFGKGAWELVGKKCYHEFEKRDAICPHCPAVKAMATGQPAEVETEGIRDDGSRFFVRLKVFPVFGPDGRSTGFIELVDDITDRKRVQESLQRAKEAAEAASRAKSDFLANMSHEIRTPMAAILGFADILQGEISCCEICSEAGQCERRGNANNAIDIIRRNGEHLLAVINDILDLSKIEAGKVQIERTRSSPLQIMGEVAALMRIRAETKQLALTIEQNGPMPETVYTDPLRLRQILANLVGNAIKFTDRGHVRLLCQLVAENGSPRVQFQVVDTGVGMTEEELARLFQPFTQVDASAARKFGGSGLGLAISKRLAETLGGTIEVRSVPGEGSVFIVTIDPGPLDGVRMVQPSEQHVVPSPSVTAAAQPQTSLLHIRILLAEDGLDNQRLIRFLLEKAGAEVTAVENGQSAVEQAWAAVEQGQPFDVILMDMQMPTMDGYAATRQLRERGFAGPIIALTAHAMTTDREKCLNAGCDDYLAKPVDRARLLETVRRFVQEREMSSNSAAPLASDAIEQGGLH